MKFCPKCKTRRDESEFWKCRSRGDGLWCYCKKCMLKPKPVATIGKICSICKIDKPKDEYYVNKNIVADGLQSHCKECHKQLCRKSQINHPETNRRNSIKYYKNNLEYCREKMKAYCKNNRKLMSEKHKKWRSDNKDRWREHMKKYGERSRNNLTESYVRKLLIADGYTDEEISNIPVLFQIKQIKVIEKRINKLKTQKNEKHRVRISRDSKKANGNRSKM